MEVSVSGRTGLPRPHSLTRCESDDEAGDLENLRAQVHPQGVFTRADLRKLEKPLLVDDCLVVRRVTVQDERASRRQRLYLDVPDEGRGAVAPAGSQLEIQCGRARLKEHPPGTEAGRSRTSKRD